MTKSILKKQINAPVELVFQTVADINSFSKAVSSIVNVQFLSEQEKGVGTKFKETRLMNGKEVSNIIETKEYTENNSVRMVSESHGTIWDSLFTVEQINNGTSLQMTMEARTNNWLKKLMNILLKGVIANAIDKDMEAVKQYCENLYDSVY